MNGTNLAERMDYMVDQDRMDRVSDILIELGSERLSKILSRDQNAREEVWSEFHKRHTTYKEYVLGRIEQFQVENYLKEHGMLGIYSHMATRRNKQNYITVNNGSLGFGSSFF